jgi:phage baseplate assembly protein W
LPTIRNQEFLGRGLLQPLQRLGAGDFISSSGIPLVRAAITQLIGTLKGEIRWRPSVGTRLAKYKHKPNTDGLAELISTELEASIKLYEPRISTVQVTVTRQDNVTTAKIVWSVIDKNVAGNNVLVGPDSFSVII